MTWAGLGRILLKTVALFVMCNLLFALTFPLEGVGRLSVYNTLLPGRDRLPYGENPTESYSLSLDNIPAMFASHRVSRPKAADEYRVIVIGDSGAWGWLLPPDQMVTAALNRQFSAATRPISAYNLAYPIQSLLKDRILLDEALRHDPDAIIWLVTLDAFPPAQQLYPPLVQRNADRARAVLARAQSPLDAADPRFVTPTTWDRTIIGARRALADVLRLQVYGVAWAITRVDQAIAETAPTVQRDLSADEAWGDITTPRALTDADLSLELLIDGTRAAAEADAALVIVNEPIYISDGANADLRYNSWYPRWAYDSYRAVLAATCTDHALVCLDLWDVIPAREFTDSPVHLSAAGTHQLAGFLFETIEAQS